MSEVCRLLFDLSPARSQETVLRWKVPSRSVTPRPSGDGIITPEPLRASYLLPTPSPSLSVVTRPTDPRYLRVLWKVGGWGGGPSTFVPVHDCNPYPAPPLSFPPFPSFSVSLGLSRTHVSFVLSPRRVTGSSFDPQRLSPTWGVSPHRSLFRLEYEQRW